MMNKIIILELCELVVQIKEEFDNDTGSLKEIERRVNKLFPYATEHIKLSKLPN